MKRTSRAQWRIDTKLLCNQCEFTKTIFDRKQQDTHTCPVCNEPKEDRNHMFTYKGPTAVTKREKKLTGFKKVLEDLETAPIITKTNIGSLRHVYYMYLPLLFIPSAMRTLEETSHSGISLKIKLISAGPTLCVADRV